MLRGRRERDRERLRKLADRSLPDCEFSKHPPTSFVAESMKDSVQPSISRSTMWLNMEARLAESTARLNIRGDSGAHGCAVGDQRGWASTKTGELAVPCVRRNTSRSKDAAVASRDHSLGRLPDGPLSSRASRILKVDAQSSVGIATVPARLGRRAGRLHRLRRHRRFWSACGGP